MTFTIPIWALSVGTHFLAFVAGMVAMFVLGVVAANASEAKKARQREQVQIVGEQDDVALSED